MIQRIQSVYLFLASIVFIIFAIYKAPISLTAFEMGATPSLLALITAVLSFVAIFLFKNRKKQLLLVKFLLAFAMILLPLMFVVQPAMETLTDLWTYFALAGFILLFFAHAGILKDEKLIKSLDRLR